MRAYHYRRWVRLFCGGRRDQDRVKITVRMTLASCVANRGQLMTVRNAGGSSRGVGTARPPVSLYKIAKSDTFSCGLALQVHENVALSAIKEPSPRQASSRPPRRATPNSDHDMTSEGDHRRPRTLTAHRPTPIPDKTGQHTA
jgi:hypothetical protein